ncbi:MULTISPECIES: hypothetical protein [Brevibacterium]|uniref:hypothetical protein n=1 Tax=Brevibacterium TaxID=1696 RepID=UPI0018695634|nr:MULTISPECIES: hypothetical protein [Brevibacterium]
MFRVLTTKQLFELDMPRQHLAEAIGCCLYKVRRGYFVLRGRCDQEHHAVLEPFSSEPGVTFPTFHGDIRDEIERLRLQISTRRGSLLPGDVFSHVSAALLHGLDPVITGTKKVEVSRNTVTRNYPGMFVYSRKLEVSDVAEGLSYPITTLTRTLADVALDHSLEVSVPLISQSMRDRGVSADDIRRYLKNGRRGLRRAHVALELSGAAYEAPSESFCAVKFHRHGITGMVPQVDVRSATGKLIGRNDFQHDTVPVVVEVHGVGKYYLHPDGPDEAAKQNHQRNMNLLNAGYQVFNLTFGDLFRPGNFTAIKNCIDSLMIKHQRRTLAQRVG